MKHDALDKIFGPYYIGRPSPGGETWPRTEAYPRNLYEHMYGVGVAIPDVPQPYLRAIKLYEEDPVGNARAIWRAMLRICVVFDHVRIEAEIRASAKGREAGQFEGDRHGG